MDKDYKMELEALPYFKHHKSYQVSTHAHDRIVPDYGHLKKFHKMGVKHRDHVSIGPAETFTFPELIGPGKINNMWFTAMPMIKAKKGSPMKEPKGISFILKKPKLLRRVNKFHKFPYLLKHVYIKIYFDDSKKPSVNAPLGVFFGCGFGEYKHFMSRYIGMTSGAYVCQFHMPFRKKARVEIVNTLEDRGVLLFFGAVTYMRYEDEKHLENQGYFHAEYRAEEPTKDGIPYTILEVKKDRGHFMGMVLNTYNLKRKNGFLNLEGNMEIYVDGETEPSLEFTGTEDVFQGAWYYVKPSTRDQAEFYCPYHGLTIKSLNKWDTIMSYLLQPRMHCKASQYRFFPEGIPFSKSFKCIIHHGEFDEIPCNYNSVAYWYQDSP
ncbi:MAG: glycoside hydrolase family 172 protein [Candidatus Helarchaeota archaeon]